MKKAADAWSTRTFERTGGDLRFFAEQGPDAPITVVNPSWMRTYLERISQLALSSQGSRYAAISEFLGWCVRKGHLKRHPDESIDPSEKPWLGRRARKKRGRGKPQLRNAEEVAAYLRAARSLSSPERRVASCLPLLVGLRSGEVRHLQVGDVDFVLSRLRIRAIDQDDDDDVSLYWDLKTAAGTRTTDLPEILRADLLAICKGQQPDQLAFTSNRNPGQPYERKWLNRMVKRVCQSAGTKVVCAHGLRDTYSSFMHERGRSTADIGTMLGHADDGATARNHYIGVPAHDRALVITMDTDDQLVQARDEAGNDTDPK